MDRTPSDNSALTPREWPISPQRAATLVLLSIIGVLLAAIVVRVGAEALWGPPRWNSPFLAVELLIVIPAAVVVRRHDVPFRTAFRLRAVGGDVWLASFFLGAGLAIIGDQLDRIVQSWFPMPPEIASGMEAIFRNAPSLDFALILVIGTVGAGFAEEMLFRGFFQGVLERQTRLWIAIFFPAALFGLIHFIPWLVLQITILGVVLGLLAWRSQSIFPSVVVHATNNLIAMLLIRWNSEKLEKIYLKGDFVNPVVVLLAIALFIFSWQYIWKNPAGKVRNGLPG